MINAEALRNISPAQDLSRKSYLKYFEIMI